MRTKETTPHGGEAALVEQISTLQKQLDDCLENDSIPFIFSGRLEARLECIIVSALINLAPYDKQTKKNSVETQWPILWRFKDCLFQYPHFGGYWQHKEFRDTVNVIIELIDTMKEHYDFSFEDHMRDGMLVSTVLTSSTHKGWSLLIQALRDIYKNPELAITDEWSEPQKPEELDDLRICFEAIGWCVKTHHDAKHCEPSA